MKLKFILIISIGIGILAAIICRGWIDMKNKEIEELKSQLDFIAEQNNYISRLEKEIKLMKSININENYISKCFKKKI